MAARLDRLMVASGLKRNTILEMALEQHLPALEAKYKVELEAIREKKTSYSTAVPLRRSSSLELNDPKPKSKS